jgi:hypothetical protein
MAEAVAECGPYCVSYEGWAVSAAICTKLSQQLSILVISYQHTCLDPRLAEWIGSPLPSSPIIFPGLKE